MQESSPTTVTTSTEEHRTAGPEVVRVSIVTISDTRTVENDESGGYLRQQLQAAGHEIVESHIVPDDAIAIRSLLVRLVQVSDVVFTTGGTGITGRDVTVPVVESLLVKPIPGFGELFRMLSYSHVRGAAMLSRAVGGLGRGALIFAMPGSPNAVQIAWDQILSTELSHLVYEMVRHGQDHGASERTQPLASSPSTLISPTLAATATTPTISPDKPLTPEEEHEMWKNPFEPKNNRGASAGIGRHVVKHDNQD